MVADGVEETMTGDRRDQLLSEERKEYAADGGKVEVVDLEQEVELEWLTSAHQFATAEDYDVVCDEEDRAALERRERGFALDEAEVLRLVAGNGLKSLLEDRPELDTKGAVQRRNANLNPIDTHCILCAGATLVDEMYVLRAVFAECCAEAADVNKQARVEEGGRQSQRKDKEVCEEEDTSTTTM